MMTVVFPVNFPGLGILAQYICPSFDISPAIITTLLKDNGKYVHRSTYRQLTTEEIVEPLEVKARERFDIAINEN